MIQRKQLPELKKWHASKKRKPLILRGARQVGKTTLVRELCRSLDLDLIEVNLEFDSELRGAFSLLDPEKIVEQISVLKNTSFTSKSLLFIDEIQTVPEAIQCLRYFYEKKPDLPVIAAGSLLEFVLNEHEFSMPVGRVEYMYIGPLQFREFLVALQEYKLFEIYENFELKPSIASNASDKLQLEPFYHNKFLELFYDFLHTGGMPEVVSDYITEGKSFEAARKTQRIIIQNYKNDFPKYSKQRPYPIRVEKVFDYIPSHIGQKVKYSEISSSDTSRDLRAAIDLLVKANVLIKVIHTSASGIPLKIGENEKIFKLLFLDSGLATYMLKLDPVSIKDLYLKPNNPAQLLYKGIISEQFVGQNLAFHDNYEAPELNYWLRDERSNNAEIDFVIQLGMNIVPIEVKAGRTGSIKSVIQFVKEKKSKYAIKMGTKLPEVHEKSFEDSKFNLVEIPLYFAERVYDLMRDFIQ